MKTLFLFLVLAIAMMSCESPSSRAAAKPQPAPVKCEVLTVTYDLHEGQYYTKVKNLETNTVSFRMLNDRYDKGDIIMLR